MEFDRYIVTILLVVIDELVLSFTYLLLCGIVDKIASTYCKKCKGFSRVDSSGNCERCNEKLEIDSNNQLSVFGFSELKHKDGNINYFKCIIASLVYIAIASIPVIITVLYVIKAYKK